MARGPWRWPRARAMRRESLDLAQSYVSMAIILLMFLARFATRFCKEAFSCIARYIIFDRPKMVQGFIAAK